MTVEKNTDKQPPGAAGRSRKDARPATDERAQRLAAALKANLRRRKAQARGRRNAGASEEAGGEGPR